MGVTIVDNGSSYLPRLVALCGPSVDVVSRRQAEKVLPRLKHGLIVLSGGHGFPVAENPGEYEVETYFLKTTSLPVIGVCLGFELMVVAHGGRLSVLAGRERGLLNIDVVTPDPIFQQTLNYRVFESHRWVAAELGSDLVGLAKSKDGFEIVRHQRRPQYGFQFHPEMFDRSQDGIKLFQSTRQYLMT